MAPHRTRLNGTRRQEGGVKKGRLPKRAGVEITIHIDAAERSFNRVNHAVLIAIQLLKMVMGQIEASADLVRWRSRHEGGDHSAGNLQESHSG